MKSIFNLDSPVMTILTEIADLIILNLIYLFFCMPIVTIGAATAALYRVMLNYEKGESVNPVRQFWKAFRENWKGATILFLIMLIPMACMLYYFLVIAASIYGGSKLTLVMSCIAALIIMMLCHSFAQAAQFENKIGSTIKNSLILSIVHFPRCSFDVRYQCASAFVVSVFSGAVSAVFHRVDHAGLRSSCENKHEADFKGVSSFS